MSLSPDPPERMCPVQAEDHRIAALVAWLPDSAVESWEERAAIRQYDAGYAKRDAEVEALLDVLVSWGPLRVGTPWPRLFRRDTPNGPEWLLSCDTQRVADLNRKLAADGALVEVDLLGVLADQFGGVAVLVTSP